MADPESGEVANIDLQVEVENPNAIYKALADKWSRYLTVEKGTLPPTTVEEYESSNIFMGIVGIGIGALDGAFIKTCFVTASVSDVDKTGKLKYAFGNVIYFAAPELLLPPYGYFTDQRLETLSQLLGEQGLNVRNISHHLFAKLLIMGKNQIPYVASLGNNRERVASAFKTPELAQKYRMFAHGHLQEQNRSIGLVSAANQQDGLEHEDFNEESFVSGLQDYAKTLEAFLKALYQERGYSLPTSPLTLKLDEAHEN